ncbi:MAG: saccharopine dehydrogenase NADP-binding domain-containing protein [Akkermansiaceae bacterium]|nr:saccharopine dehydrogenase NADP-binding domain-containing protein [Akkermansiaceae bacterium]
MKNILVLGGGMVGGAMAIDLANTHHVTCADRSEDALRKLSQKCPTIATSPLDVTDATAVGEALAAFELVVCAVPGFLGFRTLKQIIEAGKNVIDISFFPEDALALHGLALEHGVTAIVDCGVAPGMANVILGYHDTRLKITDYECLVGGLPKERMWPFEYKAPFSPVDVIEEYTRPARYVENGEMITMPPLTDLSSVEFDRVGTLESFNSDGLRTLCFTMPHIPNMKEKTLRYPGHADKILMLQEAGFFNTNPVEVNGSRVTPLDFTSRILFDDWKLGETEEELTVMRITIKGRDAGGTEKVVISDLHDEYNRETHTSSMARTTGYTATAAANLVLDGLFSEKGVIPPEKLGQAPGACDYMLRYLADRGVHYSTVEH